MDCLTMIFALKKIVQILLKQLRKLPPIAHFSVLKIKTIKSFFKENNSNKSLELRGIVFACLNFALLCVENKI